MKSPPLLSRRSGAKRKETWYGTTGMVWTLDHNDLRSDWQDVSPEAGLTLRQAMLHYDGEKRAQEFCDLEAQGYGGEPRLLVGVDGWPTPPEVLSNFRVKSRWLREARDRLEFCLIEKLIKGRLTATGYSSAARLDEPAQVIIGDR